MNNEKKITDDKPELVFFDLQTGRTFRTLKYHISEDLVKDFMEIIGDKHPFYQDGDQSKAGPFGERIAPPGLAAIYARLSYLQDYTMPSGGVLAKQEFEFKRPIRIGETLIVNARVAEQYIDKKERKRVNFLIDARNQNNDQVCEIRLHGIWPK